MKKEDIKTLTLPEYYKLLLDFYQGKKYQGKIVKLACVGSWRPSWWYLIPAGVHDPDYYIDTIWEVEPMMKHMFRDKDEYLKNVNRSSFEDAAGMMIRCIFHEDEIVYQAWGTVPKDKEGLEKKVAEIMYYSDHDTFLGFRMDPFSFVKPFKIKDEKYIDDGHNDPEIRKYNLAEENYRVFYITMSPEKFKKEEKSFLEHVDKGKYKDDFYDWEKYGNDCYQPVWKEFIKEHTDRK